VVGVYFMAAMVEPGDRPREIDGLSDPDERIPLRIDNFRKQPVIYFDGEWITRDEIVKYVANIAEGIHSGNVRTNAENRIARVRHVLSTSLIDPSKDPNRPKDMPEDIGLIPSLNFDIKAIDQSDLPIEYDPDKIDCVIVELLASMRLLVESPVLIRLCNEIRKET
jgi:hypothetical protein